MAMTLTSLNGIKLLYIQSELYIWSVRIYSILRLMCFFGFKFGFKNSMEHILPDNLFASPKKSAADQINAFSTTTSAEVSTESTRVTTISSYNNNNNLLPTTSTSSNANATSPKSVLSKCPGTAFPI